MAMEHSENTYTQHIYQINVLDLSKALVSRIKLELQDDPQCTHYCNIIINARKAFEYSLNPPQGLNESQVKQLFLIKPTHPAFYNWFAYFLCTKEPKYIPIILEAYHSGKFDPIPNFCNAVEYHVYPFLDHIPFNHKKQDEAIMKWFIAKNYANGNTDEAIFLDKSTPHIELQITAKHLEEFKLHFVNFLLNKEQRPEFNSAMEGKFLATGNEVHLKMKSNLFCDAIIRTYNKGGIILNTKTEIIQWICHNFIFNKKGGRGKIKPEYCRKLLNGRESPLPKDQIVLNFASRP